MHNLYGERFQVKFPKGSQHFGLDRNHRLEVINFHISLELFCGANDLTVLFFHTYFDRVALTGKDYRSASAIKTQSDKYLIADAVFMVQNIRRLDLYALEVFNDTYHTQRIISSLEQHLIALENGEPSLEYKIDYGSRVLCVFSNAQTMNLVMQRLKADIRFEKAKEYFLFKSNSALGVDLFYDWQCFDGSEI